MSVYCCSDLHGRKDLYDQIKAFLKPEDMVYFLGDAGDRGPEPWKTIKAIYNDPQFIYLKGNHEDMLVKLMKANLNNMPASDELWLVQVNGGTGTYQGWLAENEDDRKEWYRRLKHLPTWRTYTNANNMLIWLTHAGFTPGDERHLPSDYKLLWDRSHFNTDWSGMDNELVVHGHTPIPLVIKDINECCEFFEGKAENYIWEDWDGGALWYCNNHKVCIDCGAAWYDCCVLLDLDTFDEDIFQGTAFKEEFLTEEV